MELHHLHVAQRQARAQRHGQAVHALVAGRRVIAVHGRPAAGRQQHGLAPRRSGIRRCGCRSAARRRDSPSFAGMSATARCSSRRRIGRAQTCSISRLMISMPVRSPLCTVRSKVWPAKALPCSVPSGLRSKKQPISFSSSRTRSTARRHQRPGEFLVRQPFAALDRVHEMALDRVAGIERDVVAALHHARAAALPEQSLGRDRDVEIGIGLQACSAANSPAPPEPRIRMSVLRRSSSMLSSEDAREKDECDDGRQCRRRASRAASVRHASPDSR